MKKTPLLRKPDGLGLRMDLYVETEKVQKCQVWQTLLLLVVCVIEKCLRVKTLGCMTF